VIDAFGGGGVMLYNREFPEGKLADGEFGDYMNSFIGEMTDFEQAALDGKALEAGPEQSLGELRTALAVYRSAKTQQWEDVWA
jgi:predicted dehydrogenase